MAAGRLINSGPGDGTWNMAVDEALMKSVAQSMTPVLRVYRWAVPTLSIGYFQKVSDRTGHSGSRSCPLVRRASGGGAILHDMELTYSLVLPSSTEVARRSENLYTNVHQAIQSWLQNLGVETEMWSDIAPDERQEANGASSFLCFQRRSDFDLVCGDAKIVGSAQRKSAGVILQHGSILLARSSYALELPGAAEANGSCFDFAEQRWASWEHGLAAVIADRIELDWRQSTLGDAEFSSAEYIKIAKFDTDAWNGKR